MASTWPAVAGIALALAASASRADVSVSVRIEVVELTLIDLDPDDGRSPWLRFEPKTPMVATDVLVDFEISSWGQRGVVISPYTGLAISVAGQYEMQGCGKGAYQPAKISGSSSTATPRSWWFPSRPPRRWRWPGWRC